MSSEIHNLVEQLAEKAKQVKFTPAYRNKPGATQDALGCSISEFFGWAGRPIMETFASALEDANFHTKAAKVREWIDLEPPDNSDA